MIPMGKIKILIVEDELIIAEKTAKIISELGYLHVGTAINYQEGITLFKETQPNIILVDINLKGLPDGIELVRELKKENNVSCIFVTSYTDENTIKRAKEVQPNSFLVKPFTKEDLFTSIEIALSNTPVEDKENPKIESDSIFVKKNNAVIKVKFKDILYITSEDIYCKIILKSDNYLVRSSLKNLLLKLPESFIRVHKSYIINFENMESFSYDNVQIGKIEIPVGRQYRDELLSRVDLI